MTQPKRQPGLLQVGVLEIAFKDFNSSISSCNNNNNNNNNSNNRAGIIVIGQNRGCLEEKNKEKN